MRAKSAAAIVGLVLALASAACTLKGGEALPTSPSGSTTPPASTPPLPVASASVVSSTRTALAAFDPIQFDGSRSTSGAAGGITQFQWNFGDGVTANGAVVDHVFQSAGEKTVTLWVTDANGTSAPASVKATVTDLRGDWQAQFNVQTRTYALHQIGTQVTGNYLNSTNGGQVWSLTASVDGPSRRISLTATYPGEATVRLSNAVIAEDARSFTGITNGGSANGAFLTYRKANP